MAKVLVVGSTGRVGQAVLEALSKGNHQTTAAARHPEAVEQEEVEVVKFDLTWTLEKMTGVVRGYDVIIDVAGSSGSGLLQIDLMGAVNLMRAAESAGVKRFILLSTVFALEPERWTTPGFLALKDYYIAKHFADHYLVHNTALDYTILQPGYLEEKSGTGKIALGDDVSAPATIEDVAATLAALVDADNAIGKVLSLHNGEVAIEEAVEEV